VLNACEATVPSQGYVRIEICSIGESFQVRVEDNGTGIPSSITATLFDPFVSLGKPNGTGLGLAIVNKIVQDHGGTVTVEKTSESGTTFLVRLPRAARVEAPVPQAVVS
jgi:signal transduction histidine kinase